jgi:chromosomal replication initiator protein
MKADEIWQAALGELQLQLTKATFDTWLKNTCAVSYEDGTFVVAVENAFARDWLYNRLMSVVKRTLCTITHSTIELRFVVRSQSQAAPSLSRSLWSEAPGESRAERKPSTPAPITLNRRYVFDSFIVGSGNRLAHAASVAVAERPATAYNPLFIYGGVGLGKTHLLHAIGHSCIERGLKVLYVTSEQFTNDLISSIRRQSTSAFRSKYRTLDVLLVDDIQFIAGKESTQEEFFHTFNALYEANHQVVISSDCTPKAILTLEERLLSRFEWGLIADIQSPDLETRVAILQSKASSREDIPDEILHYIAERVQSNIRELEGSLNRVLAYADLIAAPPDLSVAKQALQGIDPHNSRKPAEDEIIGAVAAFYQVDAKALKGRGRQRTISLPRQVAMYIMREEGGCSLPHIGKILGGRDHSTVMHGCSKIAEELQRNEQLKRELFAIRQSLLNA